MQIAMEDNCKILTVFLLQKVTQVAQLKVKLRWNWQNGPFEIHCNTWEACGGKGLLFNFLGGPIECWSLHYNFYSVASSWPGRCFDGSKVCVCFGTLDKLVWVDTNCKWMFTLSRWWWSNNRESEEGEMTACWFLLVDAVAVVAVGATTTTTTATGTARASCLQ